MVPFCKKTRTFPAKSPFKTLKFQCFYNKSTIWQGMKKGCLYPFRKKRFFAFFSKLFKVLVNQFGPMQSRKLSFLRFDAAKQALTAIFSPGRGRGTKLSSMCLREKTAGFNSASCESQTLREHNSRAYAQTGVDA